ncbi:MAG TPA: DEAD/DEAH box helicase [Candidatus Bathyarchaeia archaeon]|nr:DEAD/DEAH box helicase [Candidatus Bathyarchaeia archaeon]
MSASGSSHELTESILHPRVKDAFESRFGPLTEAQRLAIPGVVGGKNVLLVAPTGTGKTEAAMLPVFSKLLDVGERHGVSVLYITPLRALNRDMLARLTWWGSQLQISIGVRHGDTTKAERRRQTIEPPDVLITTPESLQAMLMGRRLRENLRTVRFVIIDEIHDLASSKRGAQLAIGLERLADLVGEFQRIGLSATVGSPQEVGNFLAGNGRTFSVVEVSLPKMLDFVVTEPEIAGEDKAVARTRMIAPELASHARVVREIVDKHKSTLIFVNTRQAAEALGSLFRGSDVGVHHGSLSREARIEAENEFKAGKKRALICTSSMELGIDIGDVQHVIQYNSPREVTRLVQRVGRAGHRVGESSEGTVIATHLDDIMESWVITRRAKNNAIERFEVDHQALDVLANQLCFMALSGSKAAKHVLRIVKKAYPYRDLTREKFVEVVKLLQQQRLLRVEREATEALITSMGKTRRYCYENLSMIPDEKTYSIYDTINGKWIGTLDETFVLAFAEPGAVFITRGEMWRILEVDEERIKVEPLDSSTGEIPSWVGEQIPVPYEVASDVGRLREEIANSSATARDSLLEEYCTDPHTVRRVVTLLHRQKKFVVPTHDVIVVEVDGKTAIIHACFGHKVNETLGRVISSLLAARLGSSVALEVNPYWIQLQLPNAVSAELIANVLRQIKPEFVKPLLEMTLKNSMLLKWKLAHVARKFGVIDRGVESQYFNIDKLTNLLKDTAVYEEALRDIADDKLDLDRTSRVLTQIQDGRLQVVTSKLSPLSRERHYGARDLLVTDNADRSILMALKNRILNDRVILFCLTCKKWKSKRHVANVPEQPQCPLCNSKLIAALKPWEDEDVVIVTKSESAKSPEEKARTRRVYRNANLVLSHGKKGVIALASRGLGPEAASRVIRKSRRDEEDFYRDILRHERHYTLTRKFWHN